MKKLFAVLLVLLLTVVLVVCVNDGNDCQSEDYYTQEQVDELIQYGEMIELYYEAKLDWFEEQHNIDFDDVPNDFILWLIEEHPEVYAYWLERVDGSLKE